MIYSFGGQPQIVKNGRTLADFNDPLGVKALQLLYVMRWVDQSIGPKEMGYNHNTAALANLRHGMAQHDHVHCVRTDCRLHYPGCPGIGDQRDAPSGHGDATAILRRVVAEAKARHRGLHIPGGTEA